MRFPHSAPELARLAALADADEGGGFRPVLDTVIPLTSEGVQEAFRSGQVRSGWAGSDWAGCTFRAF